LSAIVAHGRSRQAAAVLLPFGPDGVSVFFGLLVSDVVSDLLELEASPVDELTDDEVLSVLVDSAFLLLEP
jgi:hypothetical protein